LKKAGSNLEGEKIEAKLRVQKKEIDKKNRNGDSPNSEKSQSK